MIADWQLAIGNKSDRSVGANLIATAWTTDGVIEALEDPRADRFVIAVQWHPELGWEDDGFSQQLFKSFVNHAIGARESDLAPLSAPA